MIAMAVSSFPPEPSYISGKIVRVISEKTSECNHIAKCMHDSYGSISKPISRKIIHVISPHYIRFVDT